MRRKLIRYLCAICGIVSLNFFLPRFMPGDPVVAMLGDGSYLSTADVARVQSMYGLDEPVMLQYLRYWRSVLRLDFGRSIRLHAPVLTVVLPRLGWTALITLPAIFVSACVGTFLGAAAGRRYLSVGERITGVLMTPFYAAPPFFLAMVFLYVFSFKLEWFPLGGFYLHGGIGETLHHLVLPFLILALSGTARNFLIMRGSVLQERGKPYPLFAKAKGLSANLVLRRHVFPNALLPVVTLIALDVGFTVTGAIFVEIVFSLNGMGTLLFDALTGRDYPLIQGIFFILMVTVLLFNLCADILYHRLDPRLAVR